MTEKRQELKWQGHLISSYAAHGGYAAKWASEWLKGPPDLICALPSFGLHLLEVKHRPTWTVARTYENPLTPKQREWAGRYINGGGVVLGAVIFGASAATPSARLCFFHPTQDQLSLKRSTHWERGVGFNLPKLMKEMHDG